MCGLAGIICGDGADTAGIPAIGRMVDALRHRGPDDGSVARVGRALLGHRRLSIIDLEGGRQPFVSDDGRVGLVYNGEVYNFAEVRSVLRARGHRFHTRSDTEVVLRSYLEWGEGFLDRLRGMFAIGIWDDRTGTAILARDRLGIKPLYWAETAGGLIFASELKAIAASDLVERRLDEAALLDYLNLRYVPSPRTIFRGIRKLPAAHLLVWRGGAPRVSAYWDVEFAPEEGLPVGEWTDRAREKLSESVRMSLVSDVPLGAFLSGGVDSSAVVALMAAAGGGPVRTTTVGFEDADYDEMDWGRFVADFVGTDHRDFLVTPRATEALDFLAWHYDEPFGDASAVPTYYVSRVTRQRVKVALSGDGGDEVFAGYRRYRYEVMENAWRERMPDWLRRGLVGPLGRLWPKFDFLPQPLRLKTFLTNVAGPADAAFVRSVGSTAGLDKRGLLAGGVREALGDYDTADWLREKYRSARASDPLGRAQYVDLFTRLADGMLTKVDRASMAVGLEVRVPFLDHEVVELAARMPPSVRLAGSRGKAVLKDAMCRHLPRLLLERKKRGFGLPVRDWLRTDLRERAEATLFAPDSMVGDWFDLPRARSLWDDHQAGRRDASDVLWLLLCFEAWGRVFLRPARVRAPTEAMIAVAS